MTREMGQEQVLMSQKKALRLDAIRRASDAGLAQAQAAQLLGLSVRQVKRLCQRLRQHGARGLVSQRAVGQATGAWQHRSASTA